MIKSKLITVSSLWALRALAAVVIIFPGVLIAGKGSGVINVRGYTKSNGTVVSPHTRSASQSFTVSTTYFPSSPVRKVTTPISVFGVVPVRITPTPSFVVPPVRKTYSATRFTRQDPAWMEPPVRKTHSSNFSTGTAVKRDANGKIARSSTARNDFLKSSGYPNGRPGYIVDHIIPLKRGGRDCPENMQWQTIAEAKAKDKVE